MKKIAIISLIIAVVVVVGCATNEESTGNVVNIKRWSEEAPQLFSNVGYANLEESIPQVGNQSESMAELIGSITNPFGIRDDILEYIIKTIPSNNESAMRAAIKMMQYDQQVYYGNLSESEALLMNTKETLAWRCLDIYIKPSDGKFNIKSVGYSVISLMDDTKERREHSMDIGRKYFSYKVLGTGSNGYEEKIACQKGAF